MKITFIGHNNGKAITIHNSIKLIYPLLISAIIATIISIIALLFQIYELLSIWIIPFMILLWIFLCLLLTKQNDIFLKGIQTKHKFTLDNNKMYKDSKEIKQIKKIYKFRKFLFIELANSYFIVSDNEFMEGNREELLKIIKNNQNKL